MTKELLQQAQQEADEAIKAIDSIKQALAQQEQPAQEPDPVLCKFYQVTTFEELVSAQEHHINKLQAKLKKENDNGMGSILVRKSRAASDQWSGCAVVGCVASESQTGQVAKAQQEQPESVDAYVGAREDAAIWKKRALEAEELNRKFIAELNGPTYLGEPAQPTQEPVGRFVKATYGDYGVLAWHPSYVAKIGDCLYTHPAPTQPALSDEQILDIFSKVSADGMGHYMTAVGRAIEAHCRGGAVK